MIANTEHPALLMLREGPAGREKTARLREGKSFAKDLREGIARKGLMPGKG